MEKGDLKKIAEELIGIYRPKKRARKRYSKKARKRNIRAKKLGLPITDPFTMMEVPAPQRKTRLHYLHLMECYEDKRGERWYQCVSCRARLKVTSKRLQEAKFWSPTEQFVIIEDVVGRRGNGAKKAAKRKRSAKRIKGTGSNEGVDGKEDR